MSKPIEVSAGMSKLPEDEFIKDGRAKLKAMEDNSGIAVVTPNAAAVRLKFTALDAKLAQIASTELILKQYNSEKNSMLKDFEYIFAQQWARDIQNTANITEAQIKLLKFHYPGEVEAEPLSLECVPVVTNININVPQKHIISYVDSIEKLAKRPPSICRVDVYAQIGGDLPANLDDLIAKGGNRVGEGSKGKYINKLPSSAKGKPVYYILAYISSKTKEIFSCSIVYSAIGN